MATKNQPFFYTRPAAGQSIELLDGDRPTLVTQDGVKLGRFELHPEVVDQLYEALGKLRRHREPQLPPFCDPRNLRVIGEAM